jgi:hypothetical protein
MEANHIDQQSAEQLERIDSFCSAAREIEREALPLLKPGWHGRLPAELHIADGFVTFLITTGPEKRTKIERRRAAA